MTKYTVKQISTRLRAVAFSSDLVRVVRARERESSGKAARNESGSLFSFLSRLAPSITRVTIFVSRAFRSTD